MATVVAEMVRWNERGGSLVLLYFMRLSSVLRLASCLSGLTMTFLSSLLRPQTRLVLYMTTQTGAIRGFQRGEHIRRRHKWWTDLRRIRPEHLLDCSNRTGSGHSPEKDRFLSGTARGSNKAPSRSSSGNGNGRRGNGTMDVKEGNVHTFLANAILAYFVALLA